MKSDLLGPFLLLLFLISSTVTGLGSVVTKQYSYMQSHSTWQSAQSSCKSSTYNSDLATFFTQSDEDLITMTYYHAWIGLHLVTNSNIYWTWTYSPYTYSSTNYNYFSRWASSEPDTGESCATVYYTNRLIYGQSCGESFFFFCHKRQSQQFEYIFIPQSKSWTDAREHCQSDFDDLATFEGMSNLNSVVNQQDFPVWIGLHRDGLTWKWSSGLSEYTNWAPNEPTNNNGDCVAITSTGKKMHTQNCNALFPYVCFRDNLVLVKENKTWEEALEHCRALQPPDQSSLRYELVSVQPGEDHNFVINKVKEADTEEVWAGLRFLAGHWFWVNEADMLYSNLPDCPSAGQHCGVLSKNDTGSAEITDCSERRNFLCYSTY
ncbi:secretory phospholipase A2 receptor-like [Plectropomus leopardus]|uniref:secretory phospholipase A2 receptor-like n=1 Tax=Plectropomus leopardus TaxID=160734 RepID=UPI001C4C3993|nr:secretory phospholipase A2 receptor-like [Plectropomus leopardus]